MIELKNDRLEFSFPEVHPQARLTIEMQRTLRIPDDDKSYPLPPGLGQFPLRHVDDFAANVPQRWQQRGGVMMPMFQSEALWLNFHSKHLEDHGVGYPFAIKIATGKINAATGEEWTNVLNQEPQDYLVSPVQPWLDGYCVEEGTIRQFVAMPLGSGYTVEEQLTGEAEHGGIQIIVFPMKRSEFDKRFPHDRKLDRGFDGNVMYSASMGAFAGDCMDMGLAPGGRMEQKIYDDIYGLSAWDQREFSRCFVHLANSMVWRSITGSDPPHPPLTAKQYSKHRMPWFEYYDENRPAVPGSATLKGVTSVVDKGISLGQQPLPENESCVPSNVKVISPKASKDQVREGSF